MRHDSIASKVVSAAVLLTSVGIGSALATQDSSPEQYEFDVFLEDDRIGLHRVDLERDEATTRVTTTANFKYTILLIPVYTYEHRTVETWNGSCIADIESSTDDNGDEFFIASDRSDDALIIRTREGEQRIDSCVRTYAYWDSSLLDTDRLLNTQNGEYQQVEFRDLGINELVFEDVRLRARRCELVTEEGTIVLWYDENDRWVALESRVESGSMIRYLSTDLRRGGDA